MPRVETPGYGRVTLTGFRYACYRANEEQGLTPPAYVLSPLLGFGIRADVLTKAGVDTACLTAWYSSGVARSGF